MNFPIKNKVFAYITRMKNRQEELLVFTHRDYPLAGIQVPAGTVEAGEDLLFALRREVKEESGLDTFTAIKFLGKQKHFAASKQEIHHRYFYLLSTEENIPDQFQHMVTGKGEDENLVFVYKWYAFDDLPLLIAEQGALLDSAKAKPG